MARLRTEYKILLATFSVAFVASLIIHLFYLPFYWANAPSHWVRPFDLYLPSVWTPAIIYYSVLAAVFAVVTFGLLSCIRKGKANAVTVFITTFFLGGMGVWVFLAFASLLWGYTMRLYGGDGKGGFVTFLFTFWSSFVSAVSSTIAFELYKSVSRARKRLKPKADT